MPSDCSHFKCQDFTPISTILMTGLIIHFHLPRQGSQFQSCVIVFKCNSLFFIYYCCRLRSGVHSSLFRQRETHVWASISCFGGLFPVWGSCFLCFLTWPNLSYLPLPRLVGGQVSQRMTSLNYRPLILSARPPGGIWGEENKQYKGWRRG